MNASARKAASILRTRRNANRKRTISTHVIKVTEAPAVKGVTEALRKVARKLRLAGALGKVQTRVGRVDGVVRKYYRYTAVQVAAIAAAYRPRKADYVAARAALLALAA